MNPKNNAENFVATYAGNFVVIHAGNFVVTYAGLEGPPQAVALAMEAKAGTPQSPWRRGMLAELARKQLVEQEKVRPKKS
ncbi:MAG: hypothetical protein J6Y30_02955 [Treponema sp.]|nr:hypothetical protein [Treponema sp.]